MSLDVELIDKEDRKESEIKAANVNRNEGATDKIIYSKNFGGNRKDSIGSEMKEEEENEFVIMDDDNVGMEENENVVMEADVEDKLETEDEGNRATSNVESSSKNTAIAKEKVGVEECTRDVLEALTVPKLKEKLREAKLPVSGRKIELIERLLNQANKI